jgi:nitrogen fixation-related uncharacterized protein
MTAYDKKLLILWFTFTGLMVIALIPIIMWAIKSGQFSDNAAAGHLPLKSGTPKDDERSKNVSP